MEEELRSQALTAFINHDFEIALELYTQAISIRSDNAILFSERSEVNVELRKFDEALADAERAVELAPAMSMAYFRKGIACYQLKDYHTAKAAFEAGSIRVPENVKFIKLIGECDLRIAEIYGEILNPPPAKASTQVVPMEGGQESEGCQESGQIVNEVPRIEVHPAKAEPLNLTSLDNAVPYKVIEVSGAGSQRPSYSTSIRKGVDLSSKLKQRKEMSRRKHSCP